MNILRPVDRCEGIEDLDEVVIKGGIGRATSDCRLPRMPMRDRRNLNDDAVARVDHLGVRADVRLDRDDLVVLDEYVPSETSDRGSMLTTVPPRMSVSLSSAPAPLHLAGFLGSFQKAASRRTASTTLPVVGITASSSESANGSGTHSDATRRIGASSNSNPSSATIAATVAPQPP